MIHICKDGTGDFKSIQAALDALSPGAHTGNPANHSFNNCPAHTLYIHKGIYRERITVSIPHVTFIGEHENSTVITGGLYARMPMADGSKRGTFRSYSILIDTHDFTARHLTFENSSGKGPDVGQALALYVDGDRIFFENCRFLSGQDTLFTGPLPPKEKEPGGFIGPKQFAPRINGRHYYKNCYIEGDIDFIFGSATAYFEQCRIFSKFINKEINGYVTAASTPKGQAYGYVMDRCEFLSDCPEHSVYLGRPWRDFAQTVLINCYMDRHIKEEGWHDWFKTDARRTVFYGEYGNHGPGASIEKRPEWVRRLSDHELPHYRKETVLAGLDGWTPGADVQQGLS